MIYVAERILTEAISIKQTSNLVPLGFASGGVYWNEWRLEKLKYRTVKEGVAEDVFVKQKSGRKGQTQEGKKTIDSTRLADFANEHIEDAMLIGVSNRHAEFCEAGDALLRHRFWGGL